MKLSLLKRKGIKRKSGKPAKIKKTALGKIDAQFSKQIIKRDKHCQFPGCTKTTRLTCSHFISRAVKSTRFDEDNCIALCLFHHFFSKIFGFEYQKQMKETEGYDGQYTLFMKRRLGRARYAALIKRAGTSIKLGAAIQNYLATLKQ